MYFSALNQNFILFCKCSCFGIYIKLLCYKREFKSIFSMNTPLVKGIYVKVIDFKSWSFMLQIFLLFIILSQV